MSSVLATVLPVFGLIALGFYAARSSMLSEAAGRGLGDFAFNLAMPALLFRTMVTVPPPTAAPAALLITYFGANFATWLVATRLTSGLLARSQGDAASVAIASCFGNTVMLGFPLGLSHFGEAAAAPMAMVIAFHSPALWTIATLQQEWSDRKGERGSAAVLSAVAWDLIRNPIIYGVIAGSLWRLTGLGLHPIVDKTFALLGQAGIPASLVALGMSLVRFRVLGQIATIETILCLKLLLQPALAAILAYGVFGLPPVEAGAIVLLAACPTGANAFLFAQRYDRVAGSVSASVAVGTALSAVSITLLLLLMGHAAS